MILQSAGFPGFCHLEPHRATEAPRSEMIKVELVSSTDSNERMAYSVDEAAAIIGLSRDLLYDQMRAGKLAYLKVGRRRIITRQHLGAFLTRTN
jgi:excisionase family DNA binding protein